MKIEYVVSACLAGCKCRYDGKDNLCPKVKQLVEEGRAVTVCPEVMGGMTTPRIPSERKDGKIVNSIGEDNTSYFIKGVEKSIEIVKEHNIKKAILKERSPSCGVHEVYDGSFSHKKIKGMGVTAQYLKEKGIIVYSEDEIPEFLKED
jgi:uncharacterized protein YbbK (DUF523 family)